MADYFTGGWSEDYYGGSEAESRDSGTQRCSFAALLSALLGSFILPNPGVIYIQEKVWGDHNVDSASRTTQ